LTEQANCASKWNKNPSPDVVVDGELAPMVAPACLVTVVDWFLRHCFVPRIFFGLSIAIGFEVLRKLKL
jgi:hypothetical protein